jgi:TRAP-type C4-dicarboxylate transport system permease small subunit
MQLLAQDQSLTDSDYKEHRMKLEHALTIAERREKLTVRVAGTSFVLAFILMIVGGTNVVGEFDPWSKEATILSVTLGVIYAISAITWPIALAVGFSRYRPRVRELKDQIRDTSLLALHSEIAELRKQIGAMAQR